MSWVMAFWYHPPPILLIVMGVSLIAGSVHGFKQGCNEADEVRKAKARSKREPEDSEDAGKDDDSQGEEDEEQ